MQNNLRSIRAAMFDCPKDYVSSREYYLNNLQQKIDDTYEWAQNNFEIGQEINSGTLDFVPVVCRITQAIHPKTGLNRGDDYRELKFINIKQPNRTVGRRYKFDDSIWISTNTDNYSYSTKQQVVRRCNNVITYIDKEGNICTEPCIIDYAMKYSNVYYNNEVDVPQGTIIVITQKNDITSKIQINDRFIFDSQVFKVKSKIDYLRNETDVIDSTLLNSFELYIDNVAPDDDFNLKIANISKYSDIYPPKPQIVNGTKISPNITEILQLDTVNFDCYYIEDGEKSDHKYTFSADWTDESYYTLSIIDDNHFQITNNHRNTKNKLTITCMCDNGTQEKIELELKGLF